MEIALTKICSVVKMIFKDKIKILHGFAVKQEKF